MNYTRYLKQLIVAFISLLCAMVLLNLVADPLAIYRLVNEPGFNQAKTRLSAYSRVAKPIWMELYDYQRIAFGSSRTEIGIPMYGSAWDQWGGNAMNAAVSGANITTVSQLFRHATLTTNMKSAVVGLDFFMFNTYNNSDYSYPQLLAQRNGKIWRFLKGLELSLLSQNVFSATIRTLRKQTPDDDKYHLSGQMNNERSILRILKKGYPQTFPHFEERFLKSSWTPCKSGAFTYKNHNKNTLNRLKQIINDASKHNVELAFFIGPVHARLLETLDAAGLWDKYEQWKRDLASLVDAAKKDHPQLSITLWDFSGYHHYSTESLPQADGHTRMQSYIDSSHYNEKLGRRLLNRIFDTKSKDDFGTPLNTENIDSVLKQIRTDQQIYRTANPDLYLQKKQQSGIFAAERLQNGKDCLPTQI